MNKIQILFTLILITTSLVLIGCSGGHSPVIPDTGSSTEIYDPATTADNSPDETYDSSHIILGAGRILFDEAGNVTVEPLRTADPHYKVTSLLFPPYCNYCFVVQIISKLDEIWTLKVFITNPTPVVVYDVRITFTDVGGMLLKTGADSYTTQFAPVDDLTPRNPFYNFYSGQGQNEWGLNASGWRILVFERPEGAKFSELKFLVDASFPTNEAEPVMIKDIAWSNGSIFNNGEDTTDLTLMVQDWQGDISLVTADLSPIGGSESAPLIINPDGTCNLNGITCPIGIESGSKTIWMTAESGGGATYNKTSIFVKETPPPPTVAEWTMFVYMVEGGLPDDEDINEMEMSGYLPDKLNIIALWDKDSEPDKVVKVEHDPGGYNDVMLSNIIPDGMFLIPPGGLEMWDPQTLENFLLWGMEKYPAKHYILDLWDHGSGIFLDGDKPFLFRNVCGGLSLWGIRQACEAAIAAQDLVDKFDIIGFDVCLLGWIETAYALRDVTDIVVASENSEPGPGWDYGPPFMNLRDNIDTYTAEQLAYDIVEAYYLSYTYEHPYHYFSDNVTQAASRTSALEPIVIPALNAFADNLISILPDYKPQLISCRAATDYWGYTESDIGHFAYECTQNPSLPAETIASAQNVLDAIDEAIILDMHNNGVPEQASGWKIWFPYNINNEYEGYIDEYMNPDYLGFGDTHWDEFLYAFAEGGTSDANILVIDQSPWYVGYDIQYNLQLLGYQVDFDDYNCVADCQLGNYDAVFITFGMYDEYWYVWPTQADYDAIENYLNSGGKVYMESGDTWFGNSGHGGPDFGPLFGVEAVADGNFGDTYLLAGEDGSIMEGMTFDYLGGDGYPDWLTAIGDGVLALSNSDPEYGVMVTQDAGTYQTAAFSLEFANVGYGSSGNSSKLDFLLAILGLFEL